MSAIARSRVDRRGRRAADDGGDGAGSQARREITLDQLDQRLRPHSLGFVERNHPDILAPEAGEQRTLLDARMAACGRIDHERLGLGLKTAFREPVIGRSFAR